MRQAAKSLRQSRIEVVKRFMAHLNGVSGDGSVHSDGEVLCVWSHPVARWWGDCLYLVPLRGQGCPDELTLAVQSQIREVHVHVEEGI